MNIESYNLDSLRKIIRSLEQENADLREKLKTAGVPCVKTDYYSEPNAEDCEYDPDQGGRIIFRTITEDMVKGFHILFHGRDDVYAKRDKKGRYFPQCANRWKEQLCPKQRGEKADCSVCEHRDWTPLTLQKLIDHLKGWKADGTDVLGIYPLLPDGTCRFLVFDFDNHEKGTETDDYANKGDDWKKEVDALRKMCEINEIFPLVERSRSGRGAHVWILFKSPLPATLARNFGLLLLEKGSASINLRTFHYYDRMYPSQDCSEGIGNLIALPLQGRVLKEGNSAFIDRNWNAYPDQWQYLFNEARRMTIDEVKEYVVKWNAELFRDQSPNAYQANRPEPWKKTIIFHKDDVVGKLHLVLSNGVYVDALNLVPRIQNQIRSLAAFDNPEFYKNQRLGYSNYCNFRAVYMGKDEDGYIRIPRGLRENIIQRCKSAEIECMVEDKREKGHPIRVDFKGDLRLQQSLAAQRLLTYTDGILGAATAFGKTVVCSYLIAERKVSTLVLLQSKDLQTQWVSELKKFLNIREELPEYKTKTGRVKHRDSLIGILNGSKNSLTGIVDIAMAGSLSSQDNLQEILQRYGMVIVDECHHAGSATMVQLLEKVSAHYVYGVSATLKRSDNLDKVLTMMLGPVRHQFTAIERAAEQGIGHFFIPRYTRTVDDAETRENISKAYAQISSGKARNEMIAADVTECVRKGRTPLILTRQKEQAKNLYELLKTSADHVLILYGDNTDKENEQIQLSLKTISDKESIILVATGQKVGEGFDFPRLDTLMLAAPVSFDGRLEQYVGRLNRDYEGKEAVYVYDYVDSHMRYFSSMYNKRLRTYKRIGFTAWNEDSRTKQEINAIFDSGNYTEKFEQDLAEADRKVVISSPEIQVEKAKRILEIIRPRLDAGVKVTVITTSTDVMHWVNDYEIDALLQVMEAEGIAVVQKSNVDECFAVIDDELVWHGGMNLLGKEDAWDNLIRIHSIKVAEELMGLAGSG